MQDDEVTIGAGAGPTRSVTPFVARTPTPATSAFAPGAIIAGRYRVVALLGRGGMGEVYRADDLTLEQTVALKFLPAGVAHDSHHLAQFHNELRTARQVSHKNVVRLYDLGEADGRRFLTMEYVDGEDLAALLRRIGRFPEDRAVAVARQLCAGVAAAHERGVIHRDLKPHNVMLDREGDVRITDFGIATAAADAGAALAGTPQYMAPEQLSGAAASVKTDIYALGLILFELFTGKRPHEAKTLGELKALHESSAVTTPSSIVQNLDPAIERVILRCLERDPQRRPASALAVAAALPGGDPLAAALASGETPSPEMLAAAGEAEAMPVGYGLIQLAGVIAGLVIIIGVAPRASIVGRVPFNRPPAVLADRAEQIRRSLGYTDAPADSASSLSIPDDYLFWIAEHDSSPQRWERLRSGIPPTVVLWQRTSPRLMTPGRPQARITPSDPPMSDTGMTLTIVDTEGRLQEFHAVPPQIDPDRPATTPRWEQLFELAELPFATFTATTPKWTPRDYADTRAAWDGPLPGRPDMTLHVEAASYKGRPVFFQTSGPWSRPSRMQPRSMSTAQMVVVAVAGLLLTACVLAALLLARFNIRSKRADLRGANRLALCIMIGYSAAWAIAAHHVPDVIEEMDAFSRSFGAVLVSAALLWVIYASLEPYVRRFWPDGILGWTRLLSGYVRDPRVGREILLGCAFAVALTLIEEIYIVLPPALGLTTPIPLFQNNVGTLNGITSLLAALIDFTVSGVYVAMFSVLGFVLLRMIFRRTSVAIAALVGVFALFQATQLLTTGEAVWIAALFQMVLIAMLTTVLVRYGLLVTAIMFAVGGLLDDVPMRLSLSHWTAFSTNLSAAVVIGLAFFGFYASRAGQPLFGTWDA